MGTARVSLSHFASIFFPNPDGCPRVALKAGRSSRFSRHAKCCGSAVKLMALLPISICEWFQCMDRFSTLEHMQTEASFGEGINCWAFDEILGISAN